MTALNVTSVSIFLDLEMPCSFGMSSEASRTSQDINLCLLRYM
jgi:hypothetical protein